MATRVSKGMNTSSPSCNSEDYAELEDHHSHDFNLKLGNSKTTDNISCHHPQRLLEVIRPSGNYIDRIKDDQHITVQIGEASMDTAVATHFPCCLLKDGELVTLRASKDVVERDVEEKRAVLTKEHYCLFYIETKPGVFAKKKALFRSSAIKGFRKLCVYGAKGMTIREALNHDGRFSDCLDEFKLADIVKDQQYISCDQEIDRHHGKTFQICYDLGNKCSPKKAARMKDIPVPIVFRVDEVMQNAQMTEEKLHKLRERLRENNPDLREKMQQQFPENTFQEALKKVDFGKAQQSFSDVYRLEKLLKLGKSVCKLIVGQIKVGTAFVLFKNYILTNAHLLIHDDKLLEDVEIYAQFNYLREIPNSNTFYLQVKKTWIDFDKEMDYAILELDVNDQNRKMVPGGLMKLFSPIPKSGEACIIGHPKGEVKKLDTICIIEKKRRVAAVREHCSRFKDDEIALSRISDQLKAQGIEYILMSDDVLTYDTFMYHGSSGSPLFNAQCRVVALHTSGFVYDFPVEGSVLEMALPVLKIFGLFVNNLKDNDQKDLLRDIRQASKGNHNLLEILNGPDSMDID